MKRNLLWLVVLVGCVASCSDKGGDYRPPAMPQGAPAGGSVAPDRQYELLKDLVRKDPGNKDAWVKLGNITMDSERYQEAVDAYSRALAIDPKDVNVRVDLGTCYRAVRRPDKAVEEYRKAIKIDPRHLYAHKNLAVVLANDLFRPEEAAREFEEYLRLSPNAPDAVQVRGYIAELKAKK